MERFGAPNFLQVINAFEAGSRRAERNKLAELDELGRQLAGEVVSGNMNKLSELTAANPQLGMQVASFTQQQKKDFLEEFSRQAYSADSPEKWRAMIGRYKAQGRQFAPGEDDWSNRDALIASAMSVGDRFGLDLRREQNAAENSRWQQQFTADQNYKGAQLDIARKELALKSGQAPDLVELYDEQTGQPYKARYNPQTRGFDRVGGIKAPSGTQLEVGPDGAVSFTQGMGKPPNEGQGKDISYLNRILTAAPILDKNDEALTSFGENVAGSAPLVGNYMKSSQFQQAEQAGRNFLTALLRKESGAQIPPSEERSYGDIFLPRPGDKREVIAQKREARRQAAIGIKMGLPAHIIKGMIQQGVDFTALNPADTAGGKGDKAGASPNRTQNGINWSIE